MDDLTGKLSELLNDPKAMEQVSALAGMLGKKQEPEPPQQPTDEGDHQSLPHVGEHDAEQDDIGDGDEGGGIHFAVAGQAVHIHKEFEGLEQPEVPQSHRRNVVAVLIRPLEGIFDPVDPV